MKNRQHLRQTQNRKKFDNKKKNKAVREIEKKLIMERYQYYKIYYKGLSPFEIWIHLCQIDDVYMRHIPHHLDRNAILLAIKLS